jgi:muconate cycloisomerase
MEVERCIEEAGQAIAEGARTLKCKTGLDPERDVRLIRELREHYGDAVRIRVDANEGYATVQEAVEVTRTQADLGVFLCEQPMANKRDLARIAARIDIPVMADESAWTVQDILELDELDAAACFSCYVTKPGGLYRARRQADIAETLGMYCDIGGSIELGIGNAANLHLGAATRIASLPSVMPTSRPAEAAGTAICGNYYNDDVITEAFGYEDGFVLVPQGPGLGVEVDLDKLNRYAA